MTRGADALVVGGGAVGRAIALALAEQGARVVLSDAKAHASASGELRKPASEAAAGILGAQMEPHGDGPLARLCLASRDRFEPFVRALEAKSGVAIEYRPCGVNVVAFDAPSLDALDVAAAWQREAGLPVDRLDAAATRAAEAALGKDVFGALRFAKDARVDPVRLLEALTLACRAAGVVEVGPTSRVLREGPRARGAELEGEELLADCVALCAGCWSSLIDGGGLEVASVAPARGQMLELLAEPGLLNGVVVGPDAYLSPRDDGRVLVGSTVELVGYTPVVTASAARDLLAGAIRLVPALAGATLSRVWAGLRPRTPDELPILGAGPFERLLIATGHFRNGVLLAPITAEIVAALVAGKASSFDLAPFACARFASPR